MLTLKIGDTYPDTSGLEIPVVMRSPLFSEGKGSYIFNFKLPATDELKAELGHFHRPGRYGASSVKKPLSIKYGPITFIGTATISKANPDAYEVSCPVDNGDLAQLFKSINLKDIDLGGVRESVTGSTGIDSYSTEQISYNLTNTTEVLEIDLPFDNIIINPDEMLNSTGDSIDSDFNGELILIFSMEVTKEWGYVYFEAFKGAEELCHVILETGTFFYPMTIPVEIGDSITWHIQAGPQNDGQGHNYLRFTIAQDARLQAYKQGILDENKGVQLYPVSDYACFPFENTKMLDNFEDDIYQIDHVSIKEIYSKFFPVLNYYANDFPLVMLGESEGESFVGFNLFNPFPYLAYMIRQMASGLGITIDNNIFEHPDQKQLVIFNLFAENSFITSDLIKPLSGFNLQDHVPDVMLSDYWINLCRLLGVTYSYKSDTKTLTLKYLKDIATDTDVTDFPGIISGNPELTADAYNGYRLEQVKPSQDEYVNTYFKSLDGLTIKGTVSTINLLPAASDSEINDCYYVSMRKEWWIFNYDTELTILNWIFFSKDFQHVLEETDDEISDSTYEVKSEISAVMMNNWDLLDHNICATPGRNWLIPVTMQPGNFDGFPDYFKSDFSKGLLFYHGLRYDSDDNLYPLASNDVYDFDGNQVAFESTSDTDAYTHSLSLKWDGEFGLYEKRYKNWIDMLLRSRGFWTISAYLTPSQLAGLDMFKWYSAPGYRFLIKEIRFKLFKDHISMCEIEIFIK